MKLHTMPIRLLHTYWLLPSVLVASCSAEIGAVSVARRWTLVSDDTGALLDPAHPEYGTYPNPLEMDRIEIELGVDGSVCATGNRGRWCGGPLEGIPYVTRARLTGDDLCVACMDIRGNEVALLCRQSEKADTVGPRCLAATMPSDQPCELCVDEAGAVSSNTCQSTVKPERGGESDRAEDGREELPSAMDVEDGPQQHDAQDTGDADASAMSPEDPCSGDAAVLQGAAAFTAALNESFAQIGLDIALDAPDIDELSTFTLREDELVLGEALCAEVLELADRRFADELGEESDAFSERSIRRCVESGECKIGQIVTRAMADACAGVPTGCELAQYSMGIIGSGGHAIDQLCHNGDDGEHERIDCTGSPLVIDLAGDGLRTQGPRAGARFPLRGGEPRPVGWLSDSDDVFLALDVDGDGVVSSGRELFGEATDGWATDGFSALARWDFNADGLIDAADPVFERLIVWADNGDAVCEPSELEPLASTAIASVSLMARALGERDDWGNELGLVAPAEVVGRGTVPVIDVWFQME